MADFNVVIDLSHIAETVESIKRARARMLRNCGPNAFMFLHRHVEITHSTDETCICGPVVIAQNDPRPSIEFAKEILYPVAH